MFVNMSKFNEIVLKIFQKQIRANWYMSQDQMKYLVDSQPHHGVMSMEKPRKGAHIKNLFLYFKNDLYQMKGGFTYTVNGWIRIWCRMIQNAFRMNRNVPAGMTKEQRAMIRTSANLETPIQNLTKDPDNEDISDEFSEVSLLPSSEAPFLPLELEDFADLSDLDEFEDV